MPSFFSTAVRVLACDSCGAPFETVPSGGTVQCSYCNAANQVAAAKSEPVEPAAAARSIDEGQRLAMLRQQDDKPLELPSSLQSFVQDGAIPDWKIAEARAVWQTSREALRTSDDFELSERLVVLTLLLNQHYQKTGERLQQRAMLESALEAVTLPRHRQIVRGYLARFAALEGDVQGALGWLAPCNPRSEDLQADSAYRVSKAVVDTAQGDMQAVLELLGAAPEQVPIAAELDGTAMLIRANALERVGQTATAAQQLALHMAAPRGGGRHSLRAVAEAFGKWGWQLCPTSLPQANAAHMVHAGKAAATRAGGSTGSVYSFIGWPLTIVGTLLSVLSIGGVVVTAATEPAHGEAAFGIGLTVLIIGLVLLGLGIGFVVVGRGGAKAGQRAMRLHTQGLSGQGAVIEAARTGRMINKVPEYRVKLTVQISGRAPYESATVMPLYSFEARRLAPGAVVPLRVDPNAPHELLIELG